MITDFTRPRDPGTRPIRRQRVQRCRLLRAARIWLDPMLNLDLISAAEAKRVLMEEVMEDDLSAPLLAKQGGQAAFQP
jgi:hypothetical protein